MGRRCARRGGVHHLRVKDSSASRSRKTGNPSSSTMRTAADRTRSSRLKAGRGVRTTRASRLMTREHSFPPTPLLWVRSVNYDNSKSTTTTGGRYPPATGSVFYFALRKTCCVSSPNGGGSVAKMCNMFCPKRATWIENIQGSWMDSNTTEHRFELILRPERASESSNRCSESKWRKQ